MRPEGAKFAMKKGDPIRIAQVISIVCLQAIVVVVFVQVIEDFFIGMFCIFTVHIFHVVSSVDNCVYQLEEFKFITFNDELFVGCFFDFHGV